MFQIILYRSRQSYIFIFVLANYSSMSVIGCLCQCCVFVLLFVSIVVCTIGICNVVSIRIVGYKT